MNEEQILALGGIVTGLALYMLRQRPQRVCQHDFIRTEVIFTRELMATRNKARFLAVNRMTRKCFRNLCWWCSIIIGSNQSPDYNRTLKSWTKSKSWRWVERWLAWRCTCCARDLSVFVNTIPFEQGLSSQGNWWKLETKQDFLLWPEWPESASEIYVDFWSARKVALKPYIQYP